MILKEKNIYQEKLFNNYHTISFDIYNTLIKRSIEPAKLYTLMEQQLRKKGCTYAINFAWKRVEAEKELQKKKRFIYSLSDIYRTKGFLDLSEENRKELMECEEELEISNTFSTEIGLLLYDKCIREGKQIICISDMYLRREVIEKILKRCGYEISNIFVSCEFNACKRNGKLFRIVLSKLGIKNRDVVHIGDAKRSDFINPQIAGIKSYLINSSKRIYNQNYYYRLGLETLGPIIYEFNCWVQNQSNQKKLLFLSREGEILGRFYEEQFHEKVYTLYVSRKAVLRGVVYEKIEQKSFLELLQEIKLDYFETVSGVFEWLGIDIEQYKGLLEQQGIYSTDKVNAKIFSFLDENKHKLLLDLRDANELFQKYLEENFKEEAFWVDIGWQGSMQNLLQNTLFTNKKRSNKSIEGLYFGVLDSQNKKGFLFSSQDAVANNILCFSGLLEILLMPHHGSVIGYERTRYGVSPIFDKSEFSISSYYIIDEVQRGITDLIKHLKFIDGKSCFDVEQCSKRLIEFGCNPHRKDIDALSKLEFYDNSRKCQLVSDVSLKSLCFPSELIQLFSKSKWKTAFCQKLLGIRLPYNRLISICRKMVR